MKKKQNIGQNYTKEKLCIKMVQKSQERQKFFLAK